MKSAIYLGKENIEVKEVPIPECGDNDVLIKNIYSSICGTDVAVYSHGPGTGHRVTIGGEFGHETISRVAAVGRNAEHFKVGERVYPYPLYAKNDTSRAGTLGGFSEYILCPNAKRNHSLYPVDDGISDKTACLIEPFTVGGRTAKQAKPVHTDQAAVFGCGTIGISAAIMLQYLGVQKIMLCDHSDFRLSIAKDLGFEICNSKKSDFKEEASRYFGTSRSLNGNAPDINIWIDAAGANSIFHDFMEFGVIESRFVSVAVNKAVREVDMLALTYASKSLIGSGGYRPEDVTDVMDIMKSGRWDIERIITHEFLIDDLDTAIQTASDADHAFNVIVHF